MATAPRETILLLEEIAANAVAAEVTQVVGGWLLRAWPGAPFRRPNSVLPIRGDRSEIDARIALVEDFYRRRGLPVRYQMSPVAAPPELDDVLAARGYEVEATTLVQTADAGAVAAATAGDDALEVTLVEAVDESWLAANAGAHGTDDGSRSRVASYGRLLGRLGPGGAAVVARAPDLGAAGAGFVVVERGWAGVFGMGTTPRARRRGVASAVLHALARQALTAGATRLYLQVEQGNEIARALYARAGFATAYRYHYRSLGVRSAHG